MRPRQLALLGLLLSGAACRRSSGSQRDPDETGSGGKLSASWIGADTGKLSARPRAVFCTGGNRLELTAVKGDAGVGLAIYPVAAVVPGSYDAFDPVADSIKRPGVAGAARWFTEREIDAYQSDWGSLQLTRDGQGFAGVFALHMRKIGGAEDSIVLNGRFSGVMPGPCPQDSVSPPEPAQ